MQVLDNLLMVKAKLAVYADDADALENLQVGAATVRDIQKAAETEFCRSKTFKLEVMYLLILYKTAARSKVKAINKAELDWSTAVKKPPGHGVCPWLWEAAKKAKQEGS